MLTKLKEIHSRLMDLQITYSDLLGRNDQANKLMGAVASFIRTNSVNNQENYQVVRTDGEWYTQNVYEAESVIVDSQVDIDLLDAAAATNTDKFGDLEAEIILTSESIFQEREALRMEYSSVYPTLETEEDKTTATNYLHD